MKVMSLSGLSASLMAMISSSDLFPLISFSLTEFFHKANAEPPPTATTRIAMITPRAIFLPRPAFLRAAE